MAVFSSNCKISTLLLTSISCLIFSIMTKLVLIPYVIDDQIHKTMELIEGTKGFLQYNLVLSLKSIYVLNRIM